jgi:hypothetical protein
LIQNGSRWLLFEFGKFFRIIKKLPVEASFRPVFSAPQKGECHGLEAKITNYGGIVLSRIASEKNEKLGDVVLWYDNLNEYIGNKPHFGALIGRYGNRIAKGRFTINAVKNGIFIESKNIKHIQKKSP